jgi:hypothetical protein
LFGAGFSRRRRHFDFGILNKLMSVMQDKRRTEEYRCSEMQSTRGSEARSQNYLNSGDVQLESSALRRHFSNVSKPEAEKTRRNYSSTSNLVSASPL